MYWRVGVEEMRMAASPARAFVAAAARYLPGLSIEDLDGSSFAGVRAQAVGRDGTLVSPSPAATSAFALAREVVDRLSAGPFR